jgi:hypothetical protein
VGPENPPKEVSGQAATGDFRSMEDEVPGVPNEVPAGLKQPLPETFFRNTVDCISPGRLGSSSTNVEIVIEQGIRVSPTKSPSL